MMRLRQSCGALLLALASSAAPALAADEIVGSVLAVRGVVFADVQGAPEPLAVNAPVRAGVAIVSHDGKAKIALHDGSVISIGENARVRIDAHDGAARKAKTKLALIAGALRLFVSKASTDGSFEVESETAIAAVRGTDWIVDATRDHTAVAVLSGRVAVTGREAAAGSTVLLTAPGEGTDVRRGTAPTPPVPWGARRLADVLARATFN
jgi:hypothetical protein